jgi:carbamoylphosphate synthase large subunit
MDIIIHTKDSPGKLRASLASDRWDTSSGAEYDYDMGYITHKASITPKDVRAIIEKAVTDGWVPTAKGQHELRGPLALTDYSVQV